MAAQRSRSNGPGLAVLTQPVGELAPVNAAGRQMAEGKPERMRELAEELVRLKVDVIVAPSSIYTGAAKRATSTIPIVFISHADPLASGHVASLARPAVLWRADELLE